MQPLSDIWRNYQREQRNTNRMPVIPVDETDWPESWLKTHYKEYDRLPKVKLKPPVAIPSSVTDAIQGRYSHRDFIPKPLSLETVSQLLYWSLGKKHNAETRHYPSGGARYPVEIYLVHFFDSEDFKAGLYHYNFKENSLDVLWERPFNEEERKNISFYKWAHNASAAVFMTGVFDRSVQKYGERGYRFSLLEAGHIGQNLTLIAAALHLRSCPLGSVKEEYFEKLLDLNSHEEQIIYSLVIGV